MASTSEIPENCEEKLLEVFENGMKIFEEIENTKEPTNSTSVQHYISTAMRLFEKATRMVSISDVFSVNESVEELSTESIQYLLLPALLGSLSLKLTTQPRREVINIGEIYFRDFLQRCKDYGITNVNIPQPAETDEKCEAKITATQSEQARLTQMVMTREDKLKRYREQKELQDQLSKLKTAMQSLSIDESTKREYFITLIKTYVNQAVDDLNGIESEKPLLDYMEKNMKEGGEVKKSKKPPPPLKPIIITKDAMQKAVYGLGYPSIPVMSIEEFYEQRVREGSFPAPQKSSVPTSLQDTAEADMEKVNDQEDEQKEKLAEEDDPEALQRARNMDEYKDDNKRGWGNRHNRS